MNKLKHVLLTAIALLMLCAATHALAAAKTFTDVNASHWAKSSIDYLTDREVIYGYQDGRYGVSDPITRAQAASMIMRTFGWGDLSGQEDPGYPDLQPSHWAYNEIAALYGLGIFTPEGSYKPNQPVTRAEMADMLVKAFDLYSITAVKFTDLTRDHWAYESINRLAGKGVTSGYPDGSFRPDANVTRAEFAVLMTKVLKEDYSTVRPGFDGAIYDLEVGGQTYQLDEPLLLTDRWLAPAELFEKMGYYLESHAAGELDITTTDGRVIHLYEGQFEVWVGDTSVQVDNPLVRMNGQYYIAVHGILEVLEKPLVFYPDQFIIRLESPRITVAQINRELPEAVVRVIHSDQPYWHWSKRDRDYLELIRRDGAAGKSEQLLEEMKQLTDTYYAVEQEKLVIRGVNYFSDSVSGKLDAISRGIEARYKLLYAAEPYAYPAVGTSGAVGGFSANRYEFDYIVYDHNYDHYPRNKQLLIDAINTNTDLPLEQFKGLNIHAIPFSIREVAADGSAQTWAGLASGSRQMLVVNSGVGTFVHEFGHNWDSRYGDHTAYLKLRGKEGYTPKSSDWADRVVENFAEDFVAAFLTGPDGDAHKGVFGQPTSEQIAAIRQFVSERTPAAVTEEDELIINGAILLPDVLAAVDGKLHVQGKSSHHLFGMIKHIASGTETTIDFTANSQMVDQVVQLPEPGIYQVNIGGKSMMIVYP